MYLEADLTAATDTTTVALPSPTNGTSRRLSTIELIMMAGVTISAISLAINIWNLTRKAASS